jgi:hypothetical protein
LRTRQDDSRTELSRLGGQLEQMRHDVGVMHEELDEVPAKLRASSGESTMPWMYGDGQ